MVSQERVQFPSSTEQINKSWYIQAVDYIAVKMNEWPSATWVNMDESVNNIEENKVVKNIYLHWAT